jgi:hypothetical protein
VTLQKRCFVYIIHQSPQGEVSLLFPYDLQQFGRDYETAKTYYMPQNGEWFELDEHVGRETFYVLASSQRLPELERLLGDYAAADTTKTPALAAHIMNAIRDLRKNARGLATTAERPATIAGNLRAVTEAVTVSATDFYGKTLTIDHQ